tara:strand:- start:3814 stop:4020 length:207 start_codon:yes stop_codon:yes gene_type:complete
MYDDVERNISETQNSQKVRLIADLLIIAPFLIYMSTKTKVTPTDKTIFIAIAAATIYYNTKNFIEYKS